MSARNSLILLLFILSACGTGLKTGKETSAHINKTFKATVNNNAYQVYGKKSAVRVLLSLFELSANTDTVHLEFDNEDRLVLTYKDRLGITTRTFEGRFCKRGYYEIFLRNIRTEIPPFVPILYSHRDIVRLRIAQTPNHDLIIDNKWVRDGNIFLLAGGSRGRFSCFFKRVQ